MRLSNVHYKNLTDFTKDETIELQTLLNNCGYGLAVDGIVGPKTIHALNSFKKQHFLDTPNVFGTSTFVLLRRYDHSLAPALTIIKEFEGLVLDAYLCPAKILTIGYGTTVYPNGNRVQRGDRVTPREAEDLLLWYVQSRIVPKLSVVIPKWSELTNNQKCALISFAYNVGEHFYGSNGFGTITRVLRTGEWSAVPNAFMLYVNPGSFFEQGLRRRREKESALWRN